MGTVRITHGTTKTITGTITAATTYLIQGGLAGGGAGGTGLITGAVTNLGIIELAGGAGTNNANKAGGLGGTLDVSGTLTSSGTIKLDAGAAPTGGAGDAGHGPLLEVSGVLNTSGNLSIAGSTTNNLSSEAILLVQSAVYSANSGGSLTNTGSLTNGGLLVIEGAPDSDGSVFNFNAGQMTNQGVLTNSGQLLVGGGGYSEDTAGTPYNYGGTLTNNGLLVNSGTINVAAGYAAGFNGVGGYGGVLYDPGTLTNNGTLNIDGAYVSPNGSNGGGTVESTGVLNNTGQIFVGGGTGGPDGYVGAAYGGVLELFGAASSNSGTIVVAGGIAGPGGYGTGGVIATSGTVTNTGIIHLQAGAPDTIYGLHEGGAQMDLDATGVLLDYGTIQVDADPPDYGTVRYQNYTNALLDVLGTLDIEAGGKVNVDGTMSVDGTVNILAASGNTPAGMLSSDGIINVDGAGVLQNAGTITLESRSNPVFYYGGTVQGSGTLVNNGLIQLTEGELVIKSLVNNSLISVEYGSISGAITNTTGHGTIQVAAGGALTLAGSISASETLVLAGPGAIVNGAQEVAGATVLSSSGGTLDLYAGGTFTLNANDTNLTVLLNDPATLSLNKMAFITAIGSSGADTITAQSTSQTLTGGLGADHLYGTTASGFTGDLFTDTAAGHNGDTIGNFLGKDMIDITDMASRGAHLTYVAGRGAGTLTVSNGSLSTSITLLGSFTTASFVLGSDSSGHALISLHG